MTQSCIMMQALYKNTWNSVCTSDKFSLSHFFTMWDILSKDCLVSRGVFSLDLKLPSLLSLHHLRSELLPCWFLTFCLFDFLMVHLVHFTCSVGCIWIPESYYTYSREGPRESAFFHLSGHKYTNLIELHTFLWLHESWYFHSSTTLIWLVSLIIYQQQFSWFSESIYFIF